MIHEITFFDTLKAYFHNELNFIQERHATNNFSWQDICRSVESSEAGRGLKYSGVKAMKFISRNGKNALQISSSLANEMKLLIIFEALSQVEKVCAMSYMSHMSLMDRVPSFAP